MTPEELKLAEKERLKLGKLAMGEEKKAAKLAELAEKKEFKDRKSSAGKIAVKVSPSIRNLQGCLDDPSIQHVPVFTVADAKASLVECQVILEECSAKKSEDKPAPISVDFAAVTEMCKKALNASRDVNVFLVEIKKRNRGTD